LPRACAGGGSVEMSTAMPTLSRVGGASRHFEVGGGGGMDVVEVAGRAEFVHNFSQRPPRTPRRPKHAYTHRKAPHDGQPIGGSTDKRGDMGHPEEIEDQPPPSGRKVLGLYRKRSGGRELQGTR